MDTLELISRTLHILFCLILLSNYHAVGKQYFLLQNFGKTVVSYEKCEKGYAGDMNFFQSNLGLK